MKRREFLAGGAALGVAAAVAGDAAPCKKPEGCAAMPHFIPPAKPAELNLCLQL